MNLNEKQEYAIKVMLDDITFMMFDLEMGGHISVNEEEIDIGNGFSVSYKRELLQEILLPDRKNIISDFFIAGKRNGEEIVRFITRGEQRKFTVFAIEGFACQLLMNQLQSFREEKFSINKSN